jgi:hypothetical protein
MALREHMAHVPPALGATTVDNGGSSTTGADGVATVEATTIFGAVAAAGPKPANPPTEAERGPLPPGPIVFCNPMATGLGAAGAVGAARDASGTPEMREANAEA